MFKGQLDRESLKQLGVPEKFKYLAWSNDICEGEDGNIYALNGNKMHLLAQKAFAYPISRGTNELPEDMAEIKNKLSAFEVKNRRMQLANLFIKKIQAEAGNMEYAFITESRDTTHGQEVFVKTPNGYQKLPEPFFIGGNAKALISLGYLLIFRKNKYEITDFIPIFADLHRIAFWGGEREIFAINMLFSRFDFMRFERIGHIEELIQTEVNTLLKIKEYDNKIALFNLAHDGLTSICRLEPKQEFKVDKLTGAIHLCDFSMNDYGWLMQTDFVYRGGIYERI